MDAVRRRAQQVVGLALVASLVWSACQGPGAGRARGERHHVLERGETVYSVARRYGVSVSELIEVNGIADVRSLPVGTVLVVPAGPAAARGAPATPRSARRDPAGRPRPPPSTLAPGTSLEFAWPLRGRLTSRFGERHSRPHEGIDLAAPRGTLVRAAEAGRVTWSGSLGDYGLAVVVRHDRDFSTVYAHHRRNRVSRGSFVDKGDVVGEVGATGNATGPHLHFEIRRRNQPLDPLALLP